MNVTPGWPERRWYLAWHPEYPFAVLRAKDAEGLAEWWEREWKNFPTTPRIDDVTQDVGALLATLAMPNCGGEKIHEPGGGASVVVIVRDGRPSLELCTRDAPRLPGEVAHVDFVTSVLSDLSSSILNDEIWRAFRVPKVLRIASEPFHAWTLLEEDTARNGPWTPPDLIRVTPAKDAKSVKLRATYSALKAGDVVEVARAYRWQHSWLSPLH